MPIKLDGTNVSVGRALPESASARSPNLYKLDYQVGDRVKTPLGSGVIVDVKSLEKPEGAIRCTVQHWDFRDHDGDTFDLDVLSLTHLNDQQA